MGKVPNQRKDLWTEQLKELHFMAVAHTPGHRHTPFVSAKEKVLNGISVIIASMPAKCLTFIEQHCRMKFFNHPEQDRR